MGKKSNKRSHKSAQAWPSAASSSTAKPVPSVSRSTQPIQHEAQARPSGASSSTPSSVMSKPHLCVTICDFLFGLRWPRQHDWDELRSKQLFLGLEGCYDEYSYETKEGTVIIDIRGIYEAEVIEKFLPNFYGWCEVEGVKYLDIIVGCKVHGVGSRRLKNAIVDLLKKCDKETVYTEKYEGGSVISIELGDKKDFTTM